jgi:hypothetical protein
MRTARKLTDRFTEVLAKLGETYRDNNAHNAHTQIIVAANLQLVFRNGRVEDTPGTCFISG